MKFSSILGKSKVPWCIIPFVIIAVLALIGTGLSCIQSGETAILNWTWHAVGLEWRASGPLAVFIQIDLILTFGWTIFRSGRVWRRWLHNRLCGQTDLMEAIRELAQKQAANTKEAEGCATVGVAVPELPKSTLSIRENLKAAQKNKKAVPANAVKEQAV